MVWLMAALSASLARQVVGDFEPGNPVSMKPMPVGNIVVGIIQCADVKIDRAFALKWQRGSTLITETTSYTRRGIVNLAVALCELDPISFESHKGDHGCTGMPPAAFTVAVTNPDRLTRHLVSYGAAHASARRQFGCVSHHASYLANHISSKYGCQPAFHAQLPSFRRLAVIDEGIHAARNNPSVRFWLLADIRVVPFSVDSLITDG